MEFRRKRGEAADYLTKKLQLDVRFYGRSATWLTISHVSGIIRGIATTFLMARWLSPETLGQFRYMLAVFGIAGIFSFTGLNSAVIRGVSQGDHGVARLALRRMLQLAPFGTLVLFIAAAERYWHQEAGAAACLLIAGIAFVPYCMSGFYGPILTGKEEIRELAVMAIVNNLVYALLFVIALLSSRNLIAITAVYFGLDILIRGSFTIREYRRLPMQGGDGHAHMALGDHVSGIGVMNTLTLYFNQLLLQRIWGYSSLATFSVASVIPEQIKNAINSMSGIFLQRLSRHEKTETHTRVTQRHFWIAMIGMAGIVLVYGLTAPILIPLFFPQYREAVLPSIVYATSLLGIPCIVGIYFFQAHKEFKRLWTHSIVQSVIQLVSSIVLVPFFGSWGAVWSRVATRVGSLPFSYPLQNKTGQSNASRSDRLADNTETVSDLS